MPDSAFCIAIVFPPEVIRDESWIANVLGNDGSFLTEEKKTIKDRPLEHFTCASDDAAFGIGTGDGYSRSLGWLVSLAALALKVSTLFLPLSHS